MAAESVLEAGYKLREVAAAVGADEPVVVRVYAAQLAKSPLVLFR
jgi:hypothetical protein